MQIPVALIYFAGVKALCLDKHRCVGEVEGGPEGCVMGRTVLHYLVEYALRASINHGEISSVEDMQLPPTHDFDCPYSFRIYPASTLG